MSGWHQCEHCLSVMRSNDLAAHDCTSQEVVQPSWKVSKTILPQQIDPPAPQVQTVEPVDKCASTLCTGESYIAETDSEAENPLAAVDEEVICIDSDDDDFVVNTKSVVATKCRQIPAQKVSRCAAPDVTRSLVSDADIKAKTCWQSTTSSVPALKSSGDFIDYTNQFSRPAQPDQSNQQSYQQSHNSGAVDRQYTSYNSQPREQLQRSGLKSLHPNANQSMDGKLPKSTACEGVKPTSGDYIDYNNQFSRQSATAKTFPPVHQEPRTWSQPPAKRFKATNDSGGGKGRWEEENGKNIYITADGRKHSGQLAYIKHLADQKKLSKKSSAAGAGTGGSKKSTKPKQKKSNQTKAK